MSALGPSAVATVVIGGGILGCSIAWHLARRGHTDVLVLERNDIGSGATARSAGLVTRGRLHRPTMQLVRRTCEVIEELGAVLGEPVGFRRVGSVRVAVSEARAAELAAMDRVLEEAGVIVRHPDPADVRALAPWLDATMARRISHVEDDGYLDAYQFTRAYAAAARQRGVRFRSRTAVRAIVHDGTRVTGVRTDEGTITADAVVDAAGAWAIGLAASIGFALGTAPVRSHYWITAPRDGWPREHPLVYLPDARTYTRPEVGGLLLGVQEPRSRTYDARTLPDDIGELALSDEGEDWAELVDNASALRTFIPALDDLPFAHHITGLSTYTPDGHFILGRAGDVAGFLVAGGCCGAGVSASGGIGAALASLVLGEEPAVDLTDFRPDRFGTIDPYDLAFRESCAAARASKLRNT